MNEYGAINAFFSAVLKADSTLAGMVSTRIYADFAPEGTAAIPTVYPMVVFSALSAEDVLAMGAVRVYTKALVQVVAVGKKGYGEISPVASRLGALLDKVERYQVTVDGVLFNVCCWRTKPVQRPEVANGISYVYRGGIFRVMVTPA